METVDFLSSLPFEVVEHILSFVDVADSLSCLRVCKLWHSLLISSRLDRFWKAACLKKLGLTQATLEDYQQHHSLVKIASSALRHQLWVRGFMSKIDKLDRGKDSVECHVRTAELFRYPRLIMNRYPQDNLTQPSCFIGHHFILCSPLFFQNPYLTVASVSTMTKTIFASSHDQLRTCLERPRQSWVFWAKASLNYLLLLIQPRGRWIGYCPLTARIVLDTTDEQGRVLLTGGCAAIACCERCFELVTFKALSDEAATWDLNVMKMGRPTDDDVTTRSCDVLCTKSIVVKLKANETVLEWKYLSHCQSVKVATSSDHYCSSHLMVCITNINIHIYKCTLTAEAHTHSEESQIPSAQKNFVMVKAGKIVIPDSPRHTLNPDTGLIQLTSIRSSQDGRLLGVIANPYQLYVWDLHTHKLISSFNLSNLAQQGQSTSDGVGAPSPEHSCRLLAMGHLYTVVAVFDEKPGGQICIIGTTSGQLLTRRDSWVQWRVQEERDYVHLVNEEWLSDLFCFNAPFFAYLNRSNSLGSNVQPLSCVQFLHRSKAKIVT